MAKKDNHLGQAYDLVIADLFRLLKKTPERVKIKLGDLGTFSKEKRKLRSSLTKKTYLYYQVSFKASNLLKAELNKDL